AFRAVAGAGALWPGADTDRRDRRLHAPGRRRLCRSLCRPAVSAGLAGSAAADLARPAGSDAAAGAGCRGSVLPGGLADQWSVLATVQLSGTGLCRSRAHTSAATGRGDSASGSEVLVTHQVGEVGVGGLVAALQVRHLADHLHQFGLDGCTDFRDQLLLGLAITR